MQFSVSHVCSPSSVPLNDASGHHRAFHRRPLKSTQHAAQPVAVSLACSTSARAECSKPGTVASREQGCFHWAARPFRLPKQLSTIATGSLASALASLGDGGGGSNWDGRGGGGGGGGGNQDGQVFEIAAVAEEEEEEEEEESEEEEEEEGESEYEDSEDDEGPVKQPGDNMGQGGFRVDEIVAEGLPVGEGVPSQEELFASLQCQPGFVCNRSDVSTDLRNFLNWGVFQDVQARVSEGKDGKSRLVFTFIDQNMPPPKSMDVLPYKGTARLALPPSEVAKARQKLLADGGPLDAKKMFQLRRSIEDWYQKRGYTSCYVTHIDGMDSGNLKVRIMEGKVNNINIIQVDSEGEPTGKPGNVPPHTILREVPFKKGQIFNGDMLRKCLRDVFALGLFESMSVNSKPNKRDDTKLDIELMVKERPMKTADLDLEWQLVPTPSGRPGVATWIPGGSLTFENGNLGGTGRQVSATATTANFLEPTDDLGYQLSYRHPDLRGETDPKRTEFNGTIFNTRKLSAVFAAGSGKEDVPAMFVDRTGAKLMVTEQLSRNSRATYGLVLEQVATFDDTGALAPAGTKPLFTGEYDANGPPTSLSGTGKDNIGFLQGNFTRDTTYYVNGMELGGRDILQVEQGIGLGSKNPVFNRHRISATRFHPLDKLTRDSKEAPKVLVLHARYGGCLGDQPPYDLFTLGGPFSVRGFSVGEVASTRFFLEAAAELRVPIKGRLAYAFAEHATDLGTSTAVLGNPTQYFKRPGSGTSVGAGVKLGAARCEFATEGLRKMPNLFIRFGDRF